VAIALITDDTLTLVASDSVGALCPKGTIVRLFFTFVPVFAVQAITFVAGNASALITSYGVQALGVEMTFVCSIFALVDVTANSAISIQIQETVSALALVRTSQVLASGMKTAFMRTILAFIDI
jgi:hypothetical protein